jgi:hypothetical protein
MITLGSLCPEGVTPFSLANDGGTRAWASLVAKLQKSKRTLVITGAGISVNAGIPVRLFAYARVAARCHS